MSDPIALGAKSDAGEKSIRTASAASKNSSSF